jgi:hypothetical protein
MRIIWDGGDTHLEVTPQGAREAAINCNGLAANHALRFSFEGHNGLMNQRFCSKIKRQHDDVGCDRVAANKVTRSEPIGGCPAQRGAIIAPVMELQ